MTNNYKKEQSLKFIKKIKIMSQKKKKGKDKKERRHAQA